ncbi:hypothetical protein ACRRVB_03340 [Candidatus Cardinium hertigii]|uniref:hypothetical protein n=1 Tax=Candidatus Cardinium hertigii TaxID=247481 RepID=UPI003D7D9258
MIIDNRLRRLLVATTFCLPALGLSGCGGYNNARLGVQPGRASMGESEQQVQQADSEPGVVVRTAENLGLTVGTVLGGFVGAAANGLESSLYGLSQGNLNCRTIVKGVCNAAEDRALIWGSIGKSAFGTAANGLTWLAPHVETVAIDSYCNF